MTAADGGRTGLSWPGLTALGLFAVHVVLLFFPPLPPYLKGSLWSYLLAYSAVLLASVGLARRAPALVVRWERSGDRGRLLGTYGVAAAILGIGWSVQSALPELFGRLSREEGLWEPLSMFIYIGAALALLARARGEGVPRRNDSRHLRLLGGLYALLALEEVDYFGIFGGLIGRIDGVYVGSPHDLVRLWAEGLLPPAWVAAFAGILLAAVLLAWHTGFLQPTRWARMLGPRHLRWLMPGVLLVALALAGEAQMWGLGVEVATLEEVLELAGAVFLGALALEAAAREDS